ncbi:hypothetical protein XHC_1345 [Xanthomonas hortorum pv. carotae str. M081]|nr:hypothetical protein XHC_1345 [Xanthomonas hortorum pv. carotae str. M081]
MTYLKARISLRGGRARKAAIQHPRITLATGMRHVFTKHAAALYVRPPACREASQPIAPADTPTACSKE